MTRVKLQFEVEMLDRLRAIAAHNGMSLANLVRHIVDQWLAQKQVPNESTIDSKLGQ